MKRLLLIVVGMILLAALPLSVWRILDNPLRRKAEPLCGLWRSMLRPATGIRIFRKGDIWYLKYYDTADELPRSRTCRLRYRNCLHCFDAAGCRTDIFHTPQADILLLVPGGTFRRIIEPLKTE